MANVVPIQALVVGVVAIVVGFFWIPHVRSSFAKAQKGLAESTERYERSGRMKRATQTARIVAPLMTRGNELVATVFQWLCVGVGALAILCYIVGFFGVNLAEVLLKLGSP